MISMKFKLALATWQGPAHSDFIVGPFSRKERNRHVNVQLFNVNFFNFINVSYEERNSKS